MELYKVSATDETPKVTLNPDTGILELEGKSLPENVSVFYDPIMAWLNEYSASPATKTLLEMKLKYFNTASSKILLDMLMKLEEIKTNGHEVVVNWHYNENDEDMEEAGDEYSDIVEDLPFEFLPYKQD